MVAGCPPLSKKLTDKISKGEYLAFDNLLLPPGHLYPPDSNKSTHKKPRRVVNSLPTWLEAWNGYARIAIATTPQQALELRNTIPDDFVHGLPTVFP